MKIISKKQYNEWKELEKKYAAEISANDMLLVESDNLMNEIEKKDNNYKNLQREVDKLLQVNKELGDTGSFVHKQLCFQ